MTRNGSLVITAACGLAGVLYVGLAFWPAQRAIGELRAERARKEAVIAQAPQWAREIAQLEQESASSREFVSLWQATAPRPQRLGDVYSELTLAAAAAGVELVALKPQTATEMEVLRRELVHLEVVGELHAVHEFVRRIEELPPSIWVDRLELTEPPQAGKTLRCELSLSIFGDRDDISD